MRKPQKHWFPSKLAAGPMFDIFKRLPDGNFICVSAVRGLKEARRRINRLARIAPGHHLAHSQGVVFEGIAA